jgi:hypothetical protein
MKDALKLALEAHQAMREWIDAVPDDTVLPAMPGCDRDWLDTVEAILKKALAQPAPVQPIGYVKLIDTPFGKKLKPVLTVAVPVGSKLYTTPPAQPEPVQPVAWMFQHGETGRMNYLSNDGMNSPSTFVEMNPRYALVCPLYTTPPAQPAPVQEPFVWTVSKGGAYTSGEYFVAERIDGKGWNAHKGGDTILLAESVEVCKAACERDAAAPVQEPVAHGVNPLWLATHPDKLTTPPAAPVQEPVAWMAEPVIKSGRGTTKVFCSDKRLAEQWDYGGHPEYGRMLLTPLYTTPPAAQPATEESSATQPAQPAPVQEPVAWIEHEWSGSGLRHLHFERREQSVRDEVMNPIWTPLYTTPPAQPAVPLTDELEALFTNIDHAISSGAWNVQKGSQTWEVIEEAKAAHGITKGQP